MDLTPPPGQTLDEHVDALRADGKLGDEDVDAIKGFAAFLADPEVQAFGPPGPGKPGGLPLSVLERHQHALGISDDDLAKRRALEAEIKAEQAPITHHISLTPNVARELEAGGSVRTLCCGRDSATLPEHDVLASLASSANCPGTTDG